MTFAATSIVLCSLAVLDGVLCGFRAAAGRDGRIDKRSYYRRAMLRGAAAGALSVAACAAVGAVLLAVSARPEVTRATLTAAGERALLVYVPYATIAVAGILAWLVSPAGRTLATIIVLGPFTLARPIVVLAGLAAAVVAFPGPALVVQAVAIALATLTLESRLRARHPIDPELRPRQTPLDQG